MDQQQLKKVASRVDDFLEKCHGSAIGWENASDYLYWQSGASLANSTEPGVFLKGSLPLPDAFTSMYEQVQSKSFMGLFPQINRAWLTVDTRLFLWEYSPESLGNLYTQSARSMLASSQTGDFHSCELFDQIILAVELVRPRPGVFSEDVAYLLAVATPLEVSLLGVMFSGPECTGEIRLMPTGYAVATDDVQMIKICSTSDGRIFMAGADGHLHAFVYTGEDTRWMLGILPANARKAYKHVYKNGTFSKLFPSYFSRHDELTDVVVDSTRNALYTLSQQGMLTVYDISVKDRVKNVRSVSITHDARNVVSLSIPAVEREFVAIVAVPPSASDKIHLIVVTSFGERIYFSTRAATRPGLMNRRTAPSVDAPQTLLCVGYRQSPVSLGPDHVRPCIHMAWWSRGCLVMADLREGDSDRLVTVFPDSRIVSRNRFGASSTSIEVVYDALELRNEDDGFRGSGEHIRTFAIGALRGDTDIGLKLRYGPLEPPRFFWVLTSHRLHLYERALPLENLEAVFMSNNRSSVEIRSLFERYAGDVICALCLKIAISNPSLATVAAQVFYGFAERHENPEDWQPTDKENGNANGSGAWNNPVGSERKPDAQPSRDTDAFSIGRAAMQFTSNTEYSDVHKGAHLFVTETLYPIWSVFLTTSRDANEYQGLAIPMEHLQEVRNRLIGVMSFFERFNPEAMLSASTRNGMQTSQCFGYNSQQNVDSMNVSDAYRAEAHSLLELKSLCNICAQALALIMIVSQQQLHRVAQLLDPNARGLLAKLRLKEIVSTEDGIVIRQALLNALFSMYPSDSYPKMQIVNQLREECPSFYGTAEEALQKGRARLREVVQRARELKARTGNGEDRAVMPGWSMSGFGDHQQLSAEQESIVMEAEMAVHDLKQAADRIFDVSSIFGDLTYVNAPRALIDLALAIGQYHEGKGDMSNANEAYRAILDTLQPLISATRDLVLEKSGTPGVPQNQQEAEDIRRKSLKNACLQTALTATSKTFLEMLFEFLSNTSNGEIDLLEMKHNEVEEFLKRKNDTSLLWRFFNRQGRYMDAALTLLKMADDEKELGLGQRMNYLSVALHNAKAATQADPSAETVLVEISDFLDVARVQLCILNELKQSGKNLADVEGAKMKLDGRVMDLSTLYNTYAKPFDLFEGSLNALCCGNYRDDAQVQSIWLKLIKREAESASHTPRILSQKLLTIGKSFYPYKFVFPVKYVFDVLERYAFERKHSGSWIAEPDWASRLMTSIGVPEGDVFDAYHDIFESSLQRFGVFLDPWAWSDETALKHLCETIVCSLRGFSSEKNREKALRVTAQCSSRFRSAGLQLPSSLVALDNELRRA